MDAETPSGGRDKIEVDQSLCTREEEDVPPEAPRHSLAQGDEPFSLRRWPWKARDVTFDDHDIIQPIGCLWRQTG
jgi:hypothetical protein